MVERLARRGGAGSIPAARERFVNVLLTRGSPLSCMMTDTSQTSIPCRKQRQLNLRPKLSPQSEVRLPQPPPPSWSPKKQFKPWPVVKTILWVSSWCIARSSTARAAQHLKGDNEESTLRAYSSIGRVPGRIREVVGSIPAARRTVPIVKFCVKAFRIVPCV